MRQTTSDISSLIWADQVNKRVLSKHHHEKRKFNISILYFELDLGSNLTNFSYFWNNFENVKTVTNWEFPVKTWILHEFQEFLGEKIIVFLKVPHFFYFRNSSVSDKCPRGRYSECFDEILHWNSVQNYYYLSIIS